MVLLPGKIPSFGHSLGTCIHMCGMQIILISHIILMNYECVYEGCNRVTVYLRLSVSIQKNPSKVD